MNRRTLMMIPAGLAIAGGVAFLGMLRGLGNGSFDPRGVPSQLIGKRVPDFSLTGFGSSDLANPGRPVLVNFFASWCAPCVEEHPFLMRLKSSGFPIWGIAYKDKPADTNAFLLRDGSPYYRLARDESGRVAIDWGVTGVPETFLLDKNGIVRWHTDGALTRDVFQTQIKPAIEAYE